MAAATIAAPNDANKGRMWLQDAAKVAGRGSNLVIGDLRNTLTFLDVPKLAGEGRRIVAASIVLKNAATMIRNDAMPGFYVGVAAMHHANVPRIALETLRDTLTPDEKKAFDIALSLYLGYARTVATSAPATFGAQSDFGLFGVDDAIILGVVASAAGAGGGSGLVDIAAGVWDATKGTVGDAIAGLFGASAAEKAKCDVIPRSDFTTKQPGETGTPGVTYIDEYPGTLDWRGKSRTEAWKYMQDVYQAHRAARFAQDPGRKDAVEEQMGRIGCRMFGTFTRIYGGTGPNDPPVEMPAWVTVSPPAPPAPAPLLKKIDKAALSKNMGFQIQTSAKTLVNAGKIEKKAVQPTLVRQVAPLPPVAAEQPAALAGYFMMNGIAGASEPQRVGIASEIATTPEIRAGAAEAVKEMASERKSVLTKILEFFGLA